MYRINIFSDSTSKSKTINNKVAVCGRKVND